MAKSAGQKAYEICLWAILFIAGIVLLGLLPRVVSRESRHTPCLTNIRNIGLAVLNYSSSFGTLPPACIADAQGRPMHSWRVLILPFLDQNELYEKYRFDEPWNGPHNSKLHDVIVEVFRCPEDHGRARSNQTSYVAVVGPETIWPGDHGLRLDDVTDGLGSTLLVVEIADSGIHWMEPRDLEAASLPLAINPKSGKGISSHHPGLACVAFADGRRRALSEKIKPATLSALLTIRGGEKINDFDY
ncbi:MAG TPA: DUF1559 domain-containing protein [Planctomycetaceae bacterium]|jgi:hypothetical protein